MALIDEDPSDLRRVEDVKGERGLLSAFPFTAPQMTKRN